MKNVLPKFVVVTFLKPNVDGLLTQADGVADGIEAHPGYFPNSAPVVQGIRDARKKLADVHQASGGLKTPAKARSSEERTLRNTLTDAGHFVESCANNNPAQGKAIIAASTFSEKAKGIPATAPLRLKYGGAPGTVLCKAKAGKKRSAFYSWRYSLDDGQTWVEVAQTNDSSTLLQGLPIGKTVRVEVAITQKNVRSAWSDSVTFVVR